jgi:phosphatidylserine/phosphatidylglycerophosphate/cardiolipin synthase-like enzyme
VNAFEKAVIDAVPQLGTAALRSIADRIAAGWPDHAILGSASPFEELTLPILVARKHNSVPAAEAGAFLRGVASAHDQLTTAVTVETVWSGPSSHAVPVRATAQALIEVIAEAKQELLIMTYSARPHDDIRAALAGAVSRGVAVTIVVETLAGAGSALAGSEPAAAFSAIPGIQLWHWPIAHRTESSSKMHAKLAVADRRVLLVSSANLTQSGVAKNIEAGLLVRGGAAPERAAEHVAQLKTNRILNQLRPSFTALDRLS